MVAYSIRFVAQNLPALLLVVALVIAAARRGHGPTAAVPFIVTAASYWRHRPVGRSFSCLPSGNGCGTHWLANKLVPV
jgi:hypothetical protein